jgi:RimJ/RimL family protein N-acetyltransferase
MTTTTTTTIPGSPNLTGPHRPADDGVSLRRLEPGDAEPMLQVFAGLGPRSRELRFLAPTPRLTSSEVRHLTAVDGTDHVAVVATDRWGRAIGVARLVRDRDDPRSAEIAVEVVDDWQGRGVGSRLLADLVRRASALGVRRLAAFVSPDNRAARALLRRAPGTVSTVRADRWLTEFAVSLGGDR